MTSCVKTGRPGAASKKALARTPDDIKVVIQLSEV
jgi:hypothetical protein